ncbi:MAG: hypothetical protein AAB325_03790, partial [Pseudomonadota bacterium]
KLQSTVEEAARSIEQSVHQEIRATESHLDTITAAATDLAPAAPAPPVTPPAIAPASPQLELGLDTSDQAARKQV